MADVELAVRFLAFQDRDIAYAGDLKKYLDTLCEQYNEKFEDQAFSASIKDKLASLNAAIEVGIKAFGENRFCRKYREGAYEPRFNRAVFDVLTYSLADPRVRKWAEANSDKLVSAFESMSDSEPEFVRSVETTTKSIDSTRIRFERWLAALKRASGISLDIPKIKAA